uniref:Protein TIC 214 n=1 Tax=Selaginella tamariscina TaxID=137178 RepID=A0A482CI54_9TRAC|nr:hypothetical chloroplast RF19 [Selaginella tamariscina]QBL76436.1 hypothetical chloroplast RF19 [Selaginella tamariscina]
MQKWASRLCALEISLSSWIRSSSSLILLGSYCGSVAALPTSLSRAPSVRASLLSKGVISARSVASGLVMGPLVIISSMYPPHLYVVLVKPHAVTLLVLPCILLYWYRPLRRRVGMRLHTTKLRAPIGPHTVASGDAKIWVRRSALLDIIILSLFHHITASSPALARPAKLSAPRHSNQFLPAISSFCGWSGGSIPLERSVELAVPEIDPVDDGSHELARPARMSIVCRIPSIIVIASCSLYLGRAPVPVPFQEPRYESRSDGGARREFSWLNAWPASAFDYQKGVRPFRYVKDCYDTTSPVRKELSQYYFHASAGPAGKRILSLSSSPGLSIFDENLDRFTNLSLLGIPLATHGDPLRKEWVVGAASIRKESNLSDELTNRTEALSEGYSLVKVIDGDNGLSDCRKSVSAKVHDTFISNGLRGRIAGPRSTRLFARGSNRQIASNSFRHNSTGAVIGGKRDTTGNHHRERSLLLADVTKRNSYFSPITEVPRSRMVRLPYVLKRKPRWIPKLVSDPLSAGSSNNDDIRSAKVKNADYAVNDRTGVYKVMKRPVPQPDYRRNPITGSMRARRRKTLVWESLQFRTHPPFFLRTIDNLAPLSAPGIDAKTTLPRRFTGEEDNRMKPLLPRAGTAAANRTAAAKRWDSATAHWIRGCLLIAQLYLRRNVVLPILIIFKNACYLIVSRTDERKEDWNELNKEICMGCNYDGTAGVSATGLPQQWHREGFQIKIVNPFYLKDRHGFTPRQSGLLGDRMKISPTETRSKTSKSVLSYGTSSYGGNGSAGKEMEFGHLTVLGYLTESPSGDRIKRPHFWRLLLLKLVGKWGDTPWMRKIRNGNLTSRPAGDSNTYSGSRLPELNASTEPTKNDRVPAGTGPSSRRCERHLLVRLDGEINDFSTGPMPERDYCPVAVPDRSEYRAQMDTKELECLVACCGNAGGGCRVTSSLATEGVVRSGSIGKDQRGYSDDGSGTGSTPTYRIVVRVRGRCLRLIRIRTRFVRILLISGFRAAAAFTRRFPPIRLDIQLVTKWTKYLLEVRHAIMHLGRSESSLGTEKDPSMRAGGPLLTTGEIRGDSLEVGPDRRNVGVVSQAYVLNGIWRLGTTVSNFCPTGPRYSERNPLVREGTARSVPGGQQGVLGKGPWARGEGGRYEGLRDLRRYNVPSEIWCRIAPRGWKIGVEHLRTRNRSSDDSPDKEQSMTSSETIRQGMNFKLAADAGRPERMNGLYRSNRLLQSYLDAVLQDSDTRRGFGGPRQMRGGVVSNNHTSEGRDQTASGNGWSSLKFQTNERKNPPFDPGTHSWMYIDIDERPHISEIPESPATRYPDPACKPDVSSAGRYAHAGRRGTYDWVEMESRESHIEGRWDLSSGRIAARTGKMRDTMNILHAVSVGSNTEYTQKGIRVKSLYESMSGDTASPLLYHAALTDSTNGMPRDSGHHITAGANGRFLTRKMLSILPNFRNRFRGMLDSTAYHDESVSRMRILGDVDGAVSSYSSRIGDTLLPRRLVEPRVLELLRSARSGGWGGSKEGAAGDNEQRSKEPPMQYRNTGGGGIQMVSSILWPGYRLEDPSRMNRPWFHTNNGSQFATSRVCIYPSTRVSMNQ